MLVLLLQASGLLKGGDNVPWPRAEVVRLLIPLLEPYDASEEHDIGLLKRRLRPGSFIHACLDSGLPAHLASLGLLGEIPNRILVVVLWIPGTWRRLVMPRSRGVGSDQGLSKQMQLLQVAADVGFSCYERAFQQKACQTGSTLETCQIVSWTDSLHPSFWKLRRGTDADHET